MNMKIRTERRITDAVFLLYLLVLLRITVFRHGFSMAHLMENGTINLTLFEDYIPLLLQQRWFRFAYLFVGNIVWFVPLGFYLRAVKRVDRIWKAALCGFVLSLLIESLQYVFGTGISELDDLILNTFGAWAGAVAAAVRRRGG